MDIQLNKELGLRIAQLRKANGLTQDILAEKLGILKPTLSSYEIGRRAIPLDLLIQLSNIFKISTDELLSTEFNYSITKPGPKSKLEKQLALIKELPKDQQKAVTTMLEMALK
jgi:transcriptional regulator with XRE-family HTH domain